MSRTRHLVVVEAYEGMLEFRSDEPLELAAARGLGLPLAELAAPLDARCTVLVWDEWLDLERQGHLFTSWMPVPATRPVEPLSWAPSFDGIASARARLLPIPATDPHHGQSLRFLGPSLRGHGLLANSDPLFYLSYRLNQELVALHRRDPITAVILPFWGGLGYMPQLARATGIVESLNVPFAVVVTGCSRIRQAANQEGLWSREAVTRRQMEDLSLGLADEVLVFGPRGAALARAGRPTGSGPPVTVPRRVAAVALQAVERAAHTRRRAAAPAAFFLYEPLEPASGALLALEASVQLGQRGFRPQHPLICAGPDMRFAPMTPRSFRDYWSSRGFMRQLEAEGCWRWQRGRPDTEGAFPVRLYPSLFEHLPEVWTELGRGSAVLLSPAAAEGLAGEAELPPGVVLPPEPDAAALATAILALTAGEREEVERRRADLCQAVADAQRGPARAALLDNVLAALEALFGSPSARQDLGRTARLLLDRRVPLGDVEVGSAKPPPPAAGTRPGSLTVVVPCYELGSLAVETVRSIWVSARPPDELLLIDDGSTGEATRRALAELEAEAVRGGRPLRVIRQPNRGLAAARNAGIAAATGEFISCIDGDDLIAPPFFRLAVELLQRFPALGGVAAWSILFNEEGVQGHWNAPQPELPFLFTENCVFVPTVVRTALLRELGGYDVFQRYNYEDWELSCRMLAAGWPIVTIPSYLQHYRVRRDSLYRTMTPVQNQVMRELMLGSHRETVDRFGVEIAMLMENRLMRGIDPIPSLIAGGQQGVAARAKDRLVRTGRSALEAALRRVRPAQ